MQQTQLFILAWNFIFSFHFKHPIASTKLWTQINLAETNARKHDEKQKRVE